MPQFPFKLFSFVGKTRVLHLSWVAFLISFMVWFNHAPLMNVLRETFGLSVQEVKVILIINVALTIPARVVVGMLVDRFGPRLMFSGLLILAGLLCIPFALANDFTELAISRFFLGFVGAGFVIGTRIIGEWFPARQTGTAQGIYGGWGNFGSAASALILPSLAMWFGGEDGWRYAIGVTGAIAFVYGIFYYFNVTNTPAGSTYFKPKKVGAMEISSKFDLLLYIVMSLPLYLALAILVWKLSPSGISWLSNPLSMSIYLLIAMIYLYQTIRIFQVNKEVLVAKTPELYRYEFKQVAIMDLAYMVTFGSELALISMLPMYYMDTFELSVVTAGILAAIYPFMNLVARPAGGYMSDRVGRKKTLIILFIGISFSFIMLGFASERWSLFFIILNIILCGLFSKSASGAVYAMVPLIKRRMTGQIAGLVGAYGNVGGLLFLTVLSFVSNQVFFLTIGLTATVVLVLILLFLTEPEGQTAEIMEDGTVQMIDVS